MVKYTDNVVVSGICVVAQRSSELRKNAEVLNMTERTPVNSSTKHSAVEHCESCTDLPVRKLWKFNFTAYCQCKVYSRTWHLASLVHTFYLATPWDLWLVLSNDNNESFTSNFWFQIFWTIIKNGKNQKRWLTLAATREAKEQQSDRNRTFSTYYIFSSCFTQLINR